MRWFGWIGVFGFITVFFTPIVSMGLGNPNWVLGAFIGGILTASIALTYYAVKP